VRLGSLTPALTFTAQVRGRFLSGAIRPGQRAGVAVAYSANVNSVWTVVIGLEHQPVPRLDTQLFGDRLREGYLILLPKAYFHLLDGHL
jgi:hypothetical protein